MVAAPIFIVYSNTFQLHLRKSSLSFKYGNGGMEVRLGHLSIHNVKREGENDGSKRWCGSLSSSFFSFEQSHIVREDKDGKNGVFEEEEEKAPNTLLTLSSSIHMYSSASISTRVTNLRNGS